MINENYRESIQSLDKLIDKTSQPTPYDPDHGAQTNIARDDGGPNSNVHRRVTHDPRTVVIEIPDNKRRKISNAMTTGKNVIEGEWIEEVEYYDSYLCINNRLTYLLSQLLALPFPMSTAEKPSAQPQLRLITICSRSTTKRSSWERMLH
jgi:hypothetical protein